MFDKLVSFPSLLTHPNLTVELLLLREDHVRASEPVRTGRRTREPGERQLLDVLDRIELCDAQDLLRVLPPLPQGPFSTRELASALGSSIALAQRTAYCLRALKLIELAGRRGRTPLHRQPADHLAGAGRQRAKSVAVASSAQATAAT